MRDEYQEGFERAAEMFNSCLFDRPPVVPLMGLQVSALDDDPWITPVVVRKGMNRRSCEIDLAGRGVTNAVREQ
jgi:hypothetical protein